MVKVWWQYLTMFIVALIAGASFTILTFSPKDNILETSATGKVVSCIMDARDVDVDFDLNFNTDDTNISANGKFLMDLDEETNKISIDVLLNLYVNNTPAKIHLTYKDDIVYFSFDEQNLKFATSNIEENLGAVIALVSPLVQDIKLPFDINTISMDKLQSLVTLATEKKFSDHYEVYFPLDDLILGLGTAVIEANLDFMPTKIYLKPSEKVEQKAFDLSFSATTNLKPENLIITPTTEQIAFNDLSNMVSLASMALGTLKDGSISFDAKACYQGIEMLADLKLCLKPLMIQADFECAGANATLIYQDDEAYLDLMDIKIKADKNFLIEKLNGVIPEEAFSMASNMPDIRSILAMFKEFDLTNLAQMVSCEETSVATVFEETQTQKTQKVYSLDILNYNIKLVEGLDGKLASVEVFEQNSTNPLLVLTTKNEDIEYKEIDKTNYVSIETAIEKLNFVQNLLEEKKCDANIEVAYKGHTYNVVVSADLTSSAKIKMQTNILGNVLSIVYLDQTVYVKYNNIEICGTFEEAQNIVNTITQFVNENEEIKDIISKLIGFAKAQTNVSIPTPKLPDELDISKILNNISLSSQKLEIEMANGASIALGFVSSNENQIQISYEDLKMVANIEINKDLEIKHLNGYSNIKDLKPLINSLTKLYNKKELSGKACLQINGQALQAEYALKLDANDIENSSFSIKTNLFGSELILTYTQKVLYAEYKDVCLSITLDEIKDILKQTGIVQKLKEIKTNAQQIDVLSLIKTDETFADLEILNEFLSEDETKLINGFAKMFVENINDVLLSFDENGFVAGLGNNNIQLNYKDDSVCSAVINIMGSTLTLSDLETNANILAPTNATTYKKLYSLFENTKEYFENKQFAFNVSANYDEKDYSAFIKLDLNNELKLYVQTQYDGNDIFITVIGENIFIKLERNGKAYTFKANIDDIENILNIVCEYVEINKQSILNIVDMIKPYLQSPIEEMKSLMGSISMPNADELNVDITNIISLISQNLDFNISISSNEQTTITAQYETFEANIIFDDIIEKLEFRAQNGFEINSKAINLSSIFVTRNNFESIVAPTEFIDLKDITKLYNAAITTLGNDAINKNMQVAFSGNITLSIADKTIALPITAGLKICDGNICGYVETEYKGIEITLVLLDNAIYANISGFKVKLDLNNIDNVLEFVLDKINNNKINEAVENFKQTDIELEIKNALNDVTLQEIYDILFNKLSISLSNTNLNAQISGFEMNLSFDRTLESLNAEYQGNIISLDFTNFIMPEINKQSYVAIENYMSLYDNTLSMLDKNYFAGTIDFSYKQHAYSASYELNKEQKVLHIVATLLDNNFELWLTESGLYVSFAGINICGNLEDTQNILDALSEFMPSINLNDMLEEIKEEISNSFDNQNFDFDDFNLNNYVESIENNSNSITAVLADVGNELINNAQVLISTQNNTINFVSFKADNLYGKITILCGDNLISVPTNFYSVKDLLPVVNFAKSVYMNQALSGTATIEIQNREITLSYALKLDINNLENSLAKVQTELFEEVLTITYANQILYVEYKDVCLSITLDEIKDLLNKAGFLDEIDELKTKIQNTDILSMIKTDQTFDDLMILSEFINEDETKLINGIAKMFVENINNVSLMFNENGLLMSLGSNKVNIAYANGSVESISANYDAYKFTLNNLRTDAFISIPANAVSYAQLYSIYENMKSYIENKQFAFNITANYDEEEYSAFIKLDLNNELKLFAQTQYEGINVSLTVINKDIFIKLERNGKEYAFKASVDDIDDVLNIVCEYVEINKQSILNIVDMIKPYLQSPTTEINNLIEELKPNITNELQKERSIEEILDIIQSQIEFNARLINSGSKLMLNAQYDGMEVSASFDESLTQIQLASNGFEIDGTNIPLTNIKIETKDFTEINEVNGCIDIQDILKLYDAIIVIKDNQVISGNGSIAFDLFGNRTSIDVSYKVRYGDNGLEGYAQTTLNGITIKASLVGGIFYLDIAGAKIYVPLDEIDELATWANNKFGLALPTDFNLTSTLNTNIDIVDIVFNSIKEFKLANNLLKLKYNDATLSIMFSNVIDEIKLNFMGIDFNLASEFSNTINFDYIENSTYQNYSILKELINSVYSTIDSKQFNINAIVDVYRNNQKAFNGNISLTADIENNLRLGGVGILKNPSSNEKYEVYLSFLNDYLYVSYNNLKLSASRSSLKDLITIALEVLGIDPQSIGILGEIDDDMHFDTTNLNSVLPEFDMANPFDLLRYIQSFVITENSFGVVVKGSEINSSIAQDKFITVLINHNGEKVTSISFENIYTGVSSSEYFNMTINFNEFTSVTPLKYSTSSYIDISNSAGLLKALLNTTKLTDYHVTATADVHINAIRIIDITKTINIDMRVKNEDGNISAMIKISNIPVLAKVNDDKGVASVLEFVTVLAGSATNNSRDLTIYYKDGYIYIYREDYKTSGHQITSKDVVKLRPSTFIADIGYYLLDFGLGFTDDILEKINESIEKTKNRATPMDISNVLKSYSYNSSSKKHSITINMEEVTANTDLQDMTIGIYTINNAQTENKDYLYKLDFILNMAFASVVSMDLSTNNMTLIGIGKPVDISATNNYVNSYSYAENVEMTYNGSSWSNSTPSTTYTANFVENGGNNVSNITAKAGTNLNLSSIIPTRNALDDGITRTTYTFAGWFDNESLSGESYSGTMPRGGITLYAKWIETTTEYKTISFVSNLDGVNVSSIKKLVGDELALPVLSTHIVDDGISRKTYTFVGWFDENGNEVSLRHVPNENITLYGRWNMTEEFYGTIHFVSSLAEAQADDITVLIGSNITLPTFAKVVRDNGQTQITYTFVGWENEQNEIVSFSSMPSGTTTLYAVFNEEIKYYHTLSFNTNQSSITEETITVLEGEEITLPSYAPITFTQGEDNIKHTFVGWFLDSNFITAFNSTTMPKTNVVLFAKWHTEIVCALKVYDKNQLIVEAYELVGTKVEITGADQDTELYENENFTGTKIIPTFENNKYYVEVTKSQVLYVRTYNFVINYHSSDRENVSLKLHANENISPYFVTLSNKTTTRSTYNTDTNFLGYDQNFTTMPKQDITVNALWQEINWATITFNTTVAEPSSNKDSATVGNKPNISSIRVNLNGNNTYTSTFNSYTATTSYKVTKGWSSESFTLKIVGWNKTGATNISSIDIHYQFPKIVYAFDVSNRASSYTAQNVTITGHTTLYAVWAIQ